MDNQQSAFSGDGPFLAYKKFVENGQFNIQQCTACSQHIFYPRAICNHCGSVDLKWVESCGEGTVYSTTIVRRRPESGPSYSVTLVDLAEGVRMLTRIVDIDPESVTIGMKVQARVDEIAGKPAVVFAPVDGGAQ